MPRNWKEGNQSSYIRHQSDNRKCELERQRASTGNSGFGSSVPRATWQMNPSSHFWVTTFGFRSGEECFCGRDLFSSNKQSMPGCESSRRKTAADVSHQLFELHTTFAPRETIPSSAGSGGAPNAKTQARPRRNRLIQASKHNNIMTALSSTEFPVRSQIWTPSMRSDLVIII